MLTFIPRVPCPQSQYSSSDANRRGDRLHLCQAVLGAPALGSFLCSPELQVLLLTSTPKASPAALKDGPISFYKESLVFRSPSEWDWEQLGAPEEKTQQGSFPMETDLGAGHLTLCPWLWKNLSLVGRPGQQAGQNLAAWGRQRGMGGGEENCWKDRCLLPL